MPNSADKVPLTVKHDTDSRWRPKSEEHTARYHPRSVDKDAWLGFPPGAGDASRREAHARGLDLLCPGCGRMGANGG